MKVRRSKHNYKCPLINDAQNSLALCRVGLVRPARARSWRIGGMGAFSHAIDVIIIFSTAPVSVLWDGEPRKNGVATLMMETGSVGNVGLYLHSHTADRPSTLL